MRSNGQTAHGDAAGRAPLREPDSRRGGAPDSGATHSSLAAPHAAPSGRPTLAGTQAGPGPGRLSYDAVRPVVTRIWEQVLRVDDLRPDDDFFELGGHSLAASQVISRMREALRVEVPLAAFFECPTIAELSAYAVTAAMAPARAGGDRAERDGR
ncbi:acyl carrier protein [Streptomyces sp. ICBB 8177]|uniref:acyl carrier protein n=1 Tax=Streptomyces sp. ICBB 8177 TaxID=563922 RepID=UPI000D681CD6|nr:acyl carrier protein [Streptomyces sp. ICBB 8177]PWI45126.1 hypothetical protein CK485_06895 [Streptomyces sp. ICBB 8177]